MRKSRCKAFVVTVLAIFLCLNAVPVFADEAEDTAAVAADKAALEIGYTAGDSAEQVTGNLTLTTAGGNVTTITWESSNTDTIANDGTVTRPAFSVGDAAVTLTATITKGEATDTKEFALP
ncbi:MAG: immunoglobulin-like domain-containing protein [bacterium]|jgi:hypothetical protein